MMAAEARPAQSARPRRNGAADVLTITDAARRLGVSRSTVAAWLASGHLLGHKLGPRLWRVQRASVEAHLRGHGLSAAGVPLVDQVLASLPALSEAECKQVATAALARWAPNEAAP